MARARISPVDLEVLWSRLISIVTEQAANVIRTAFSPLVREAGDVATALFDANGRMLAHGITGTPGHIMPMIKTMETFLGEFPADTLRKGDVLITNDPWATTGHLFDVTIATPVFRDGQLIAFIASTAHHVDVGGLGFGAEAHDVFEEGLFIPVMKFYRRGRIDESLRRLIRANVREPEVLLGDFEAQVAANELAGRRLLELIAEYDVDDVVALYQEILDRSERSSREAIRKVPDGVYSVAVTIDGYDHPLTIRLTLTIRDDEIVADYTGSSPQVRRGINVCLNYIAGYTAFALRCAIERDIPNNHGSLAPLRVVAPPGTVVSATFPAPVSARHVVGQMIPGVVLQALSQALPDSVIADGSGTVWSVGVQGHSVDGDSHASIIIASGGMGARPNKDGLSAMQYPTGTSCVPIEITELTSPIVYHGKELLIDSGGPGKFRGGLAQRIKMEVVPGNIACLLHIMGDRTKYAANGLFGGSPGKCGRLLAGDGSPLSPKLRKTVDAPFSFIIETPGGGGYGPPTERDPELVAADVQQGFVSRHSARDDYGVALDEAGRVDAAATKQLREEMRRHQAAAAE